MNNQLVFSHLDSNNPNIRGKGMEVWDKINNKGRVKVQWRRIIQYWKEKRV